MYDITKQVVLNVGTALAIQWQSSMMATKMFSGILGSDLGIRLQEFSPGWFSSYSSQIPAILAHKQPLVETQTWKRFWGKEEKTASTIWLIDTDAIAFSAFQKKNLRQVFLLEHFWT